MYKFENPLVMTLAINALQTALNPLVNTITTAGGGFSLGSLIEIPRFIATEDKDRTWTPVIRIAPPFYGYRQH